MQKKIWYFTAKNAINIYKRNKYNHMVKKSVLPHGKEETTNIY